MHQLPQHVLEAAARIRERVNPGGRVEWLDHLRANGLALWPATYGLPGVKTDQEALAGLIKYAHELPEPKRQYLLDMCTVPSCAYELLGDCLWVDQACPIVQVSHRFAAAAICTTLPNNLDIKTPWRAWLLEVPDHLLEVEDPELHIRTWLRYCLVRITETDQGQRWTLTAMANDGMAQLGTRHITTAELLQASQSSDPVAQTALEWPLDSEHERVIQCLKALVANLLVAMSDPQWCRPVGKHQPGWVKGPPREGAPPHRRFMVAKATKIDVRQQVIDYCRGGRQPAKVQSLVRGHWTTVLHGPRKSLRRLQWIQPYWRGDLEAPIATPLLVVDPHQR